MHIRAGATQIVTELFECYMQEPAEMQSHYWVDSISGMGEARHIGDYLAGMTDSYALRTYRRLFDRTPDLR